MTQSAFSNEPLPSHRLVPVSIRVPYSESAVFGPGQDDGQFWMKGDGGDVVGVALQRLHAGFVLIIPDFDVAVVGARDEVRLVTARVISHAIDALLMTFQSKVGRGGAQLPNLRSSFSE